MHTDLLYLIHIAYPIARIMSKIVAYHLYFIKCNKALIRKFLSLSWDYFDISSFIFETYVVKSKCFRKHMHNIFIMNKNSKSLLLLKSECFLINAILWPQLQIIYVTLFAFLLVCVCGKWRFYLKIFYSGLFIKVLGLML